MSLRRLAVVALGSLLIPGLFPGAAMAAAPSLPAAPALSAAEPGFRLEKSPQASGPAAFDSTLLDALPAYLQVRSALFCGWADTGMYIGTQMGRFPQLHQVAAPGADRRQLTFFPRRLAGFYLNPLPAAKALLFTEDVGGNEEFRLRMHDLRTGADRDMGAPPGRVDGLIWNDSGTAFAYSHTPTGTDRWDIRLGRTDGRDTLLLSLPGTWGAMDLRPDGKRLLAQKYVSASESELFILDLTDGRLTPLLPGEKPAYADHAQWIRGPDKSREGADWSVVFTSDRDGEFHRLYVIRPDSGAKPVAWSDPAEWDVEWASLTPDRRSLVYSLNQEGYSRLYFLEGSPTGGRKPARALADIPSGVINEVVFRPGPGPGKNGPMAFAFTLNNAAQPGDVYAYDMAKAKTVRWTSSETGGLPASSFRAPELIRYPTFDSLPAASGAGKSRPPQRRTIPAWLYLPDAKSFPGPRPTLILVHGGPEAQARPSFDPFLQFLVGRMGFAVAQPNVRGSSGYGRAWQKADDGYLRMNSVKDLGALIDWIGARRTGNGPAAENGRATGNGPGTEEVRARLDPARVAVSGRSYGGFMSLSALIEYGPRLRAGINTVGITHFPTFLKRTSGYRRDLRRAEYGDERDPRMAAFLDSISPLTRMDRIATPLLLCHGRNDPRVPYEESERIFAALKARKVPVWFMTFNEEGHAVREQESQLIQWRVTAEFLARELGTPGR
ncbi:MAG: f1pep1 2 [Fibrobacteres bacterium]|nr:f1pep1 2 [Fibrobacterota bacterium]